MKKNCSKVVLVLLVFCFVCFTSSWATAQYTITHLTLGGTWSTAQAINDLGQVVGTSQISGDMSYHGFIYYKGTITDIGLINPYDINNPGQVVGLYNTEINGDSTVRSFIYSNGVLTDLGTILSHPVADPRAQSWANGINDFTQVVGSANTVYVGLDFHAYLYSNNGMENIDPDEQSEALAINNHGAVIGNERDGRIFLYSGGMIERLDIFGAALDINDQGEFVGWGSWGDGSEGAFLYREGESFPRRS